MADLETRIKAALSAIATQFNGLRAVQTDIGNGSATSIDVTHGFGLPTPFICNVELCIKSTKVKVIPDITYKDANTVTLGFKTAPTSNQYTVKVWP